MRAHTSNGNAETNVLGCCLYRLWHSISLRAISDVDCFNCTCANICPCCRLRVSLPVPTVAQGNNMLQVVQNLCALGVIVDKLPLYRGPKLVTGGGAVSTNALSTPTYKQNTYSTPAAAPAPTPVTSSNSYSAPKPAFGSSASVASASRAAAPAPPAAPAPVHASAAPAATSAAHVAAGPKFCSGKQRS